MKLFFCALAILFLMFPSHAQKVTAECMLEDAQQLPYYENAICEVAADGGILALENHKEKKMEFFVLSKYNKSLQKEWSKTLLENETYTQYYYLITNKDRIYLFITSYNEKTDITTLYNYQFDLQGNVLKDKDVIFSSDYFGRATFILSPDKSKLAVVQAASFDQSGIYYTKNKTAGAAPKLNYRLTDFSKDDFIDGSIVLTGMEKAVVTNIVLSDAGYMSFYSFKGEKPYLMRVNVLTQEIMNKIEVAQTKGRPLAINGEVVFSFGTFNQIHLAKNGTTYEGYELDGINCYVYDFAAGKEIIKSHKLDEKTKTQLTETYPGHKVGKRGHLEGFIPLAPLAASNGFYLCLERQLELWTNDISTPGVPNQAPEVAERLTFEMLIAFVTVEGDLQWIKVHDKECSLPESAGTLPKTTRIINGGDMYLVYEFNKSNYTAKVNVFSKRDFIISKVDLHGTVTNKSLYAEYSKLTSWYYDRRTTAVNAKTVILVFEDKQSKKNQLQRLEF